MRSSTTNNSVAAEHSVLVATAVYALLCVPAYFLLEGPVGNAGTVDGSVVIGGLVLGAIMIVPLIRSVLGNYGLVGRQIDAEADATGDETAY